MIMSASVAAVRCIGFVLLAILQRMRRRVMANTIGVIDVTLKKHVLPF
jgi:hypothetical protein